MKTITLTNNEILNAINWFNNAGQETTADMNTSTKWILLKNLKKMDEIKTVFDGALNEIENKYSGDDKSETVQQEDGQSVRMVKSEYINDFVKEKTELLNQTNEIDIEVVSVDALPQHLSFSDLDILSFMIEEDM